MPTASHLYFYFLAECYNLYAIPNFCKTLPTSLQLCIEAQVFTSSYKVTKISHLYKVPVKPAAAFSGRPPRHAASCLLAPRQEDAISNLVHWGCFIKSAPLP